ncbi:hypothetical protein P797_07325 [Pseudomonas aeruginosa VRFPA04]|nr:hypothetical protein P797_07325 [Pseudomonas aeruginosa VRFPA04]
MIFKHLLFVVAGSGAHYREIEIGVNTYLKVLLDVEWIGAPLRITLSDGQHSVTVLREANGHVRVH